MKKPIIRIKLPLIQLAILLSLVNLNTSCKRTTAEGESSEKGASILPTPVYVTTALATIKPFYNELWCNGRVEAGSTAQILFEQPGMVKEVMVRNGQEVTKGQVIVKLDDTEQQLALQKAQNALGRAKVEMADILLGYNSSGDTANIPVAVKKTASIRSGLYDAQLALNEALFRLSKTEVKSPITGRIVDMEVQPNNPTSAYKLVCKVIDETSLRVKFGIMETELEWAQPGAEVQVSPLSLPQVKVLGKIIEVNRLVDNSGMVSVVASLPQNQYLIPGMNVKICIRKMISNALVLPVDAITRRQNRDVVFVMSDSLAIWRYVTVGDRNTTEAVILDGIKAGERVIVSGNATIGHEAWVKESEKSF